MIKLIIHADDFGLSTDINKAIIDCFNNGVLTSCSVVASAINFEQAKEISSFDCGVHFNLTDGRSVLPREKVKTLINKDGYFYNIYFLLFRIWVGRVSLREIEEELKAQINKLESLGIKISHADGHQHIHMFPEIAPIALKVLKQRGINKIRYPQESFFSNFKISNLASWKWYKKILLSILCKVQKKCFAQNGIKTTNFFQGMTYSKSLNKNKLIEIINNLDNGCTEIMVHPNLINGPETIAIIDDDVRQLIQNKNIELISYESL